MRRRSFQRELVDVIEPVGFVRKKPGFWVRRRGECVEAISLEIGFELKKTTITVHWQNDVTEAIMKLAMPPGTERYGGFFQLNKRIGTIVNGPKSFDLWWLRSDPDGPAEMANLISTVVLPMFDELSTLEGSRRFFERGVVVLDLSLTPVVAVICYRLGDIAAALSYLPDRPRRVRDVWRQQRDNLRHKFELELAARAEQNDGDSGTV